MLVGCLLISNFPAWALHHHQSDENHTNTPLGIVERGRVISLTSDAWRLGAQPGLSPEEIRSNWPDLRLLTRQRHIEEHVWEGVLHSLYMLTPRVEPKTPGHAFFRPVDGSDLRGFARRLGTKVGVSTRRSHALCTAHRTDIGRLCILYSDQLDDFYSSCPASLLTEIGFSDTLCHRLDQFGLRSLKQVAELTRRHLTAHFGDEGKRLFTLLHPPSDPHPIPNYRLPERLTRTYDVEHPHAFAREIPQASHHLLDELIQELGSRGTQHITLRLEATPERSPIVRLFREPVAEAPAIHRHLTTLLDGIDLSVFRRVDAFTLELGRLSQPSSEQTALFREKPAISEALAPVLKRFPGQLLHAEIHPHALFDEDRASMRTL